MGSAVRLNGKGQIAIEFLFLIVIAMIYMQTISSPALELAADAMDDVTRLAQIRVAADNIANNIESLEASVEGRRTITVFVPENGTITIEDDGVVFEITLNRTATVEGCNDTICSKQIEFGGSVSITGNTVFNGRGLYEVVLEKAEGSEVINVRLSQ